MIFAELFANLVVQAVGDYLEDWIAHPSAYVNIACGPLELFVPATVRSMATRLQRAAVKTFAKTGNWTAYRIGLKAAIVRLKKLRLFPDGPLSADDAAEALETTDWRALMGAIQNLRTMENPELFHILDGFDNMCPALLDDLDGWPLVARLAGPTFDACMEPKHIHAVWGEWLSPTEAWRLQAATLTMMVHRSHAFARSRGDIDIAGGTYRDGDKTCSLEDAPWLPQPFLAHSSDNGDADDT